MSINTPVDILLNIVPFSLETQDFIKPTKTSLFEKIDLLNCEEKLKEAERDIAAVGVLVYALSLHQSRYENNRPEKDNPSCPYLFDEDGNVLSPYYRVSLKMREISAIAIPNERMALTVGAKVMNGELPFDDQILCQIVDKHAPEYMNSLNDNNVVDKIVQFKKYVAEIADKIKKTPRHYYISLILSESASNTFYSIEAIFNQALNAATKDHMKPEQQKFIEGLEVLKKETLDKFSKAEPNFKFEDCQKIANCAFTLAEKVRRNDVTHADVNAFINDTQKYKTSRTISMALSAMIGAVLGMIVGAAFGFAVGFIPGAICGGIVGGISGAGLAGVSYTVWYNRNEPFNQVSSAATEIVSSQLTKMN